MNSASQVCIGSTILTTVKFFLFHGYSLSHTVMLRTIRNPERNICLVVFFPNFFYLQLLKIWSLIMEPIYPYAIWNCVSKLWPKKQVTTINNCTLLLLLDNLYPLIGELYTNICTSVYINMYCIFFLSYPFIYYLFCKYVRTFLCSKM